MQKYNLFIIMCAMIAMNHAMCVIGNKKKMSLAKMHLFRNFENVFNDIVVGKLTIPQDEKEVAGRSSDKWTHASYLKFKPLSPSNVEGHIVFRTRELTPNLARSEKVTRDSDDQMLMEVWARKKEIMSNPGELMHKLNIVLPIDLVGKTIPFTLSNEGEFSIEFNKTKYKFLIGSV